MTEKYTMGVEVNMNTRKQTSTGEVVKSSAPQTQPDSPFCIAIMGDFTGRLCNGKQTQPAALSKLIEIDRDNLEDVLANLKVRLNLQMGNDQSIEIEINELDDFHPDELYEKLDSFAQLRSLRRRLKGSKTFAQAAEEIQSWRGETTSQHADDVVEPEVTQSQDTDIDQGDLLNSILDTQQGKQASAEGGQINQLIRSIVAPYAEPKADPGQAEMMDALDRATAAHMRDILHHPTFQQIESAWLSLNFLVRRLDTSPKLKLFILDISKQELLDELGKADHGLSIIHKRFCDPAEGERPWSVLVGNYQFNDTLDDIQALARMGQIAEAANAPFISDVTSHFVGCGALQKTPDHEDWQYALSEDVNEAWNQLRNSGSADYIGLALPRFLLRLPYGCKAKQVEVFDFEEMPEGIDAIDNHEHYLWGHAAILKAELLARSFMQSGWELQPGEVHQTEKLPLHYYTDDGETVNKPVAEIYLTEKAGEKVTAQGLMPLWSVKNMDAIRSSDFRSISHNARQLKGRWKIA